jgi:21S rRNA (uridine2791-2'-O)-methyltransferase
MEYHFSKYLHRRLFTLSYQRNKTGSSKAWLSRHVHDPYVKQVEKDNHRSRAAFKLIEIQEKYKIFKPNDYVIDLGAAPGGWSVVVARKLNFDRGGLLVSIDLLPMNPVTRDEISVNGNLKSDKWMNSTHFIQGDFHSMVVREKMQQFVALHGVPRTVQDTKPTQQTPQDTSVFESITQTSDNMPLKSVDVANDMVITNPANISGSAGTRVANVVLSDMLQNTSGHASADHARSMEICFSVLDFAEQYLAVGGNLLCKFFQGSDEKELVEEAKLQFKSVKIVKPKSSRVESKEMFLLCLGKIKNKPGL